MPLKYHIKNIVEPKYQKIKSELNNPVGEVWLEGLQRLCLFFNFARRVQGAQHSVRNIGSSRSTRLPNDTAFLGSTPQARQIDAASAVVNKKA